YGALGGGSQHSPVSEIRPQMHLSLQSIFSFSHPIQYGNLTSASAATQHFPTLETYGLKKH
ncbi:hypothetical protein PJP07_30895, partial [Mycobacterium kansasii]